MCNENGEWGDIDFSSCTMRANANPLLVFEINSTSESSVGNPAEIISDVSYNGNMCTKMFASVYVCT